MKVYGNSISKELLLKCQPTNFFVLPRIIPLNFLIFKLQTIYIGLGMKKKFLFLIAAICLGISSLRAQQPTSTKVDFDKVVTGLQDYMTLRPQEKIHIHFNKRYYSVGDTIWFKVYLVNAHGNHLSAISKVVHVDFKAPNGKIEQMVLPVYAGMATAQIILTEGLSQMGIYSIKAYTQWMRNAGESYFFTHDLQVGNGQQNNTRVAAEFSTNPQGLLASVTYRKENMPLSSQEVNYQLKQDETTLFSGKIKTNADGKFAVIFPAGKLPKEPLILQTSAVLSSGIDMRNLFAVDTGMRKLILEFFPEGGSLVTGIRSKVGIKASVNSLSGYIENNQGEKIALFETAHAGMGVFAFTPLAGATYTAVVTDGEFKGKRYTLPKPMNEGVVLSVNPTAGNKLNVKISKSAQWAEVSEVRLLVQSNGQVQQGLKLPVNTNSISFTMATAELAEGINQFTVFSTDNEPLAERLVFVHKDTDAETTLSLDKTDYGTHEPVKLQLSVTDEKDLGVIGSYSVSVVKADDVALPEEQQLSIYANLLLSSDLRGHIENPNYYFTDYNEQKARELDDLMLTQGWRRFLWTDVLSAKAPMPMYAAEKGLELHGKVTTPGGKPVEGAKINLLVSKETLFLDTLSNAKGQFTFKDLTLRDSAEVMLRVRGEKEKTQLKISLNEEGYVAPFEDSFTTDSFIDSTQSAAISKIPEIITPSSRDQKVVQGTVIKEVVIAARKVIPEIKGSFYPFAAAPPDYTFEPDKLQNMVSLETNLWGKSGLMVKGKQIFGQFRGKWGPMIIMLNGHAIEDVSGINPRALSGVQIIKGGVVAANMQTGVMSENSTAFGIVFLTMKDIPEKFIKPDRPLGFLQHSMTGYTYTREFYTPKYDQKTDAPANDWRSVLLWKADIFTGEDGKAAFTVYTSNETGKFQITLEGVGTNGQLSRKVSYFTVK